MKCSDCRFYAPDIPRGWTWKPPNRGLCSSPKFIKGYGHELENHGTDSVLVEADEEWGFLVGKDFGCVHFAKADATSGA